MPTNYRTLNQTRINSSGSEWITITPTQATQTWAYTPYTTTSSSATRVYINSPSQHMDDNDGIDWTREMATNFYRHEKKTQEKSRELTDEELVKVLNS